MIKLRFLATMSIILFSTIAFGMTAEELRLQQEKQQMIEEEIRRDATPPTDIKVPSSKATDLLQKSDDCFSLLNIIFDNVTLISKSELEKLTEKYRGYCITPSLINDIIIEINNKYIEMGAITSRLYLPIDQDGINKGTLRFNALEGIIEKFIILENNELQDGVRDKLSLFSAFPFQTGAILNLKDIEQGIDVMNSLPSQNIAMEIMPSNIDGQSIVKVYRATSDANKLSLSYDNAGSKAIDENRVILRYSRYGFIGFNDTLSVSGVTDLRESPSSKYDRNLNISYQLPLGYWFFSDTYSYSKTRTSNTLVSGDVMKNDSTSINNYMDLEYNLYKSSRHKITPGINLTIKKTENYLGIKDVYTRLETSSRQLTSLSLSTKYILYFDNGLLFLKPSFVRGVNWFGSMNDNKHPYDNKAEYNMGKLVMSFSYNFGNSPLSYSLFFDSQYTEQEIFSQDRYSVGGEGSVRGYKNQSIGGMSGCYAQNELSLSLGRITEIPFIKNLNFSLFFDAGMASELKHDSEYLSGWGGKISYHSKFLNFNITHAMKINHPRWMETPKNQTYFNLAAEITF